MDWKKNIEKENDILKLKLKEKEKIKIYKLWKQRKIGKIKEMV